MNAELKIKLYATTLDCKNPLELAEFYAALLGWAVVFGDEVFATVAPPGVAQGGYPGITFQANPAYLPPVWPDEPNAQQQMAHLDFAVNDVESAVLHAKKCGAALAEKQFTDDWVVMLDPSGHPFCLCKAGHLFASPDFALL